MRRKRLPARDIRGVLNASCATVCKARLAAGAQACFGERRWARFIQALYHRWNPAGFARRFASRYQCKLQDRAKPVQQVSRAVLRPDPEWTRYSRAGRRYHPAPIGTAAYPDAPQKFPPQELPQDSEPDTESKSCGRAMSPGAHFHPSGQSHDSRSKAGWQSPDRARWARPRRLQTPAMRLYLCKLQALPTAGQGKAGPQQYAV